MDQKMKDIMIHIQLNNLCSLTNGKWHRSSTLDYTGKQTTKYTIEFDTLEESDSFPVTIRPITMQQGKS